MQKLLTFAKYLSRTVLIVIGVVFLVACAQMARHSGLPALPDRDTAIDSVRVATYNVHYILANKPTGSWSLADWERRKSPLNAAFQFIQADVVAFQEMESFSGREATQDNLTLDWLLENNPEYAAAAAGDPAVFPSTQPILYRRDRLTMASQGWFFFSETPDVIYSRTFNGSYPAFASWARFEDTQTGQQFRMVNIHTDYASRSNRQQSMELVASRIKPWIDAGESVLVVGDMNARHGDEILETVEAFGIEFAPVDGSTYHFNLGLNLFGAIDHIGWVGDLKALSEPVVVRRQFMGEWPTDHYPVVIDLELGDAN